MITEIRYDPKSINKFLPQLIISILLVYFLAGCSMVTDFHTMRTKHAQEFTQTLARKTERLVPKDGLLDLDTCIKIALANNMDIKIADINGRLAGIDRSIAFSYFLPHIGLEYTRNYSEKQQLRKAGTMYVAAADKDITQRVVSGQLALFNPSTWFIYYAYTKGEEIQFLIEERVRQAIRLQITALYIACLSQDASTNAIKSSIDQAKSLVKEIEALWREGLVLRSDLEEARLFLSAQENRLMDNRRLRSQTRSELMEAMGLSPLAEISLGDMPSLSINKEEISSQILDAMRNRLELKISDREIDIRKKAINMAILAFLPKVILFGNHTNSSNSFQYYENMLSYGISGVLTLFDGFANLQDYRTAKEEHEKAMLKREQSCMRIMLELIRARDQLDRVRDQQKLLKQDLEASKIRLKEVQALWREGLVTSSEKLGATARYTAAEANNTIVEYQYQVAVATMKDIMGLSGKEDRIGKRN